MFTSENKDSKNTTPENPAQSPAETPQDQSPQQEPQNPASPASPPSEGESPETSGATTSTSTEAASDSQSPPQTEEKETKKEEPQTEKATQSPQQEPQNPASPASPPSEGESPETSGATTSTSTKAASDSQSPPPIKGAKAPPSPTPTRPSSPALTEALQSTRSALSAFGSIFSQKAKELKEKTQATLQEVSEKTQATIQEVAEKTQVTLQGVTEKAIQAFDAALPGQSAADITQQTQDEQEVEDFFAHSNRAYKDKLGKDLEELGLKDVLLTVFKKYNTDNTTYRSQIGIESSNKDLLKIMFPNKVVGNSGTELYPTSHVLFDNPALMFSAIAEYQERATEKEEKEEGELNNILSIFIQNAAAQECSSNKMIKQPDGSHLLKITGLTEIGLARLKQSLSKLPDAMQNAKLDMAVQSTQEMEQNTEELDTSDSISITESKEELGTLDPVSMAEVESQQSEQDLSIDRVSISSSVSQLFGEHNPFLENIIQEEVESASQGDEAWFNPFVSNEDAKSLYTPEELQSLSEKQSVLGSESSLHFLLGDTPKKQREEDTESKVSSIIDIKSIDSIYERSNPFFENTTLYECTLNLGGFTDVKASIDVMRSASVQMMHNTPEFRQIQYLLPLLFAPEEITEEEIRLEYSVKNGLQLNLPEKLNTPWVAYWFDYFQISRIKAEKTTELNQAAEVLAPITPGHMPFMVESMQEIADTKECLRELCLSRLYTPHEKLPYVTANLKLDTPSDADCMNSLIQHLQLEPYRARSMKNFLVLSAKKVNNLDKAREPLVPVVIKATERLIKISELIPAMRNELLAADVKPGLLTSKHPIRFEEGKIFFSVGTGVGLFDTKKGSSYMGPEEVIPIGKCNLLGTELSVSVEDFLSMDVEELKIIAAQVYRMQSLSVTTLSDRIAEATEQAVAMLPDVSLPSITTESLQKSHFPNIYQDSEINDEGTSLLKSSTPPESPSSFLTNIRTQGINLYNQASEQVNSFAAKIKENEERRRKKKEAFKQKCKIAIGSVLFGICGAIAMYCGLSAIKHSNGTDLIPEAGKIVIAIFSAVIAASLLGCFCAACTSLKNKISESFKSDVQESLTSVQNLQTASKQQGGFSR